MPGRHFLLVVLAVAFLGGFIASSCGGGSSDGPSDPVYAELLALEKVASRMETDLDGGGGELLALADLLEGRLTPADVTVLARNYLSMMEAYRSGTRFEPDAEFYAVVDRLRDLPFFSDMPARGSPAARGGGLAARAAPPAHDSDLAGGPGRRVSALFLSNVTPACAFSCAAQGTLYALLDYGVGEVKKYYVDILASGVDCLQDAAKIGKCAASGTCTWSDFTLFAGGCASVSANVALEVSGASKVKTAYVLLKKVLSIWSVGSLAASSADWISSCISFQASNCPPAACAGGERACTAVNGTGSRCCPASQACGECTGCAIPCGPGCCAVGQRCDDGECVTCTSGCGPSCCGPDEVCADPGSGSCLPCDNPCGKECCPSGETCLESMRACCEVPCGADCCLAGEACMGLPPRCCDDPCGDDCCEPGEVCNPTAGSCEAPAGCGDSVSLDCGALCNEALAQARQRCAAMGGTLESADTSACVKSCKCLVAAVPGMGACLKNPSCPGCEDIESDLSAAMGQCGRAEVLCKVPQK